MARQLTVQPHFLHLTTQAVGSASSLVTPTIIGEYMAKVILSGKYPLTVGMHKFAIFD
jgi:hypothetical protein